MDKSKGRNIASSQIGGNILGSLKVFGTDVDGTLTDGGMYYSESGEVIKRFNTRDAFGMNKLRQHGMTLIMVTSEDSPIVIARARKLKIKNVSVGVKDKCRYFEQLLQQLNYTWKNLAYIGDDLNDLEVIKRAGFSACPSDACEEVIQSSCYVCHNSGGYGAVREVCDLIAKAINCK